MEQIKAKLVYITADGRQHDTEEGAKKQVEFLENTKQVRELVDMIAFRILKNRPGQSHNNAKMSAKKMLMDFIRTKEYISMYYNHPLYETLTVPQLNRVEHY